MTGHRGAGGGGRCGQRTRTVLFLFYFFLQSNISPSLRQCPLAICVGSILANEFWGGGGVADTAASKTRRGPHVAFSPRLTRRRNAPVVGGRGGCRWWWWWGGLQVGGG